MELSGYLAVIRRWFWTFVLAVWVAGLSAYLVASTLPPTYEAEVRVLVGPTSGGLETVRASAELVATYAELVTSRPLLEAAAQESGVAFDENLKRLVRVTGNRETRIVSISASHEDPAVAARLVTSLATQLAETASKAGTAEGRVTTVDTRVPTEPVAPQIPIIVVLAAATGLAGAVLLVLVIEYHADAVKMPAEVEATTGAPVTLVPRSARPIRRRFRGTSGHDPGPAVRSALRTLAARAGLLSGERLVRSLAVVGIDDPADSASVAKGLQAVLADDGHRVVRVDALDDESARGGSPEGDLAAVASGTWPGDRSEVRPRSASVPVRPDVQRGEWRPGGRRQTAAFLAQLLEEADVIVIDASCTRTSNHALSWAESADAVVLVARRYVTKREAVADASAVLRGVHARLVACVLLEGSRPSRWSRGSRG